MRIATTAALCGIALTCVFPAFAQGVGEEEEARSEPTYLINVDTPTLPAPKRLHLNAGVRPFGGAESLSYIHFGAEYGLSRSASLLLRGGGVDRRFYTASGQNIPLGGREYEIGFRTLLRQTGSMRFGVQGSVLFPDARPDGRLTYAGQALFSKKMGSRLSLFFTPKVLLGKTTLVTLGGGVEYAINDSLALLGDLQGAIIGANGVNTATGNSISQEVWGIGLRYSPVSFRGRASLDFGVTNGLGRSLGLSTSKGLGGGSAVYFSVSFRP